MKSQLPLEVLGLMGPLLCWVEGSERVELPEAWMSSGFGIDERVDAWLIQELPNYSRDNIDEIRWLARERARRSWRDLAELRAPSESSVLRMRPFVPLDPPDGYDLSDVFRRLGERYFEWSGNELAIQWPVVEELHELALRFPVRHLIRFRHARAVVSGVVNMDRALELPEKMSSLHTMSQGVRSVVEKGLTEGHLHLWGVMSADEGWADHVVRRLSSRSLERFPDHERRLIWLSRLTVRLLSLGSVYEVLGRYACADELSLMLDYVDRMYWTSDTRQMRADRGKLRDELSEKIRRLPDFLPGKDRERYRRQLDWLLPLIDPSVSFLWSRHRGPRQFDEHAGMRRYLRLVENLHLTVQRQLLILRHEAESLHDSPKAREARDFHRFLHRAFYRYLVLNTHYWQLATKSGRTTGVREFQRFYDSRQRVLLGDDVEVQGMVFERLSYSPSVRFVEGRVRPPRAPGDLVPWILAYAEATKRGYMKKFGLVINFLKAGRGRGEAVDWNPRSFEPLRHAQIRRRTKVQAQGLYRLLSTPHPAVPFVVGIDAANLELTTPPEVFAPAFRFLREFPISLRERPRHLRDVGSYRHIASLIDERRLGLTFHVGEDFRHLLSGLRAIDEVIRFLGPRPGDRLGHAIALGMDPRIWARQIGFQAVMSRQEALDTAVWAYFLLGPGHPLAAELRLEDMIYRLSRLIYSSRKLSAGDERRPDGSETPVVEKLEEHLSPQTLYECWHLRQLDPAFLEMKALRHGTAEPVPVTHVNDEGKRWNRVQRRVLREVGQHHGSKGAYGLLYMYWYDRDTRQTGSEIEPVDMLKRKRAWMEVCREIQAKVRKKVEREQLVVEVNPSSNRVVGPIGGYHEHHVFRLTLDDEGQLLRQIRVTVNTDDPGVFNTSLAHEYYLLAEIMMNRYGRSEPQTVEWLEWLRRNGEDYSFVRTLPDLDDPRMKAMIDELAEFYPLVPRKLKGLPRRLGDRRRVGLNRPVHFTAEQLEELEALRRVAAATGSGVSR